MITHCGLDKTDKAPEEQMHILFRFDSLNVINAIASPTMAYIILQCLFISPQKHWQ